MDLPEKREPKLLDRARDALRVRHMSLRTEKAYLHWIRRYILFHGKRHPREMGEPEINAFLTHLAVEGEVSASTQTQALCALLFSIASSSSARWASSKGSFAPSGGGSSPSY
jgi:hypothetical protein